MRRFRLFLGRFGEGIFLYKKRREFVVYNLSMSYAFFLKIRARRFLVFKLQKKNF